MKQSVGKARLARFRFAEVEALKQSLESRPELEEGLRQNFEETLKSEGVKINVGFRRSVEAVLKQQIKTDLRNRVSSKPQAKKWYLANVIEGKPLRVHVDIAATGKKKKATGGD